LAPTPLRCNWIRMRGMCAWQVLWPEPSEWEEDRCTQCVPRGGPDAVRGDEGQRGRGAEGEKRGEGVLVTTLESTANEE
jgi:hypothetical protein